MKSALVVTLCAAACALPLAAGAQQSISSTNHVSASAAKPEPKGTYKAPRNSIGQPDLGEYWTNASITPESRPTALGEKKTYTEAEVAKMEGAIVDEVNQGNVTTDPNAPAPKVGGESTAGIRPEFAAAGGNVGGYNRGWLEPGSTVMRVNGEARTSFLTTPNGRPPARKAGAPSAFAGQAPARPGGAFDDPERRSLAERCLSSFGRNAPPPMLPNGFYNNNYHIVQSRDAVAIEVEMVHDVRTVRLNGTHRTDGVRPWSGDSIGHWEGETLVVETTNFPQSQAYNGSWQNLKVTERFTRVGKERLFYQYKVEDPQVWDSAWGGEYEFAPLTGRVMEYACHEGNYALEGILAGARNDEAMAAAKRAEAPAPAAAR